MKENGLIHLYCGDGKGKTTASVGLLVRALGRGFRVVFLQFLKWQETGELAVLQSLNDITVIRGKDIPHKFTWSMSETEKEALAEIHNEMFRQAVSACGTERCLLVLDELVGTYDMGLIDKKMVTDFLENKPEGLEVVLTGRNPAPELLATADYVSEIRKVKHPMDRGIMAREGIEL